MLRRYRERYARLERILIGADFYTGGGSWRSLHTYYHQAVEQGRNVLLVDRRGRRGLRQVLAAGVLGAKGSIVINSLNSLVYWDILLLAWLRPDAVLYLHETAWMVEAYAQEHPLRYRVLQKILRRSRLLCVSEAMVDWYKAEHSAQDVAVVYETVPSPTPQLLPETLTHIVMVGSPCSRKGAELFAAVARAAQASGEPWQFHWVGGPVHDRERAPEVRWWGWQDRPDELVRQADVFFLSSLDDPQPIAALEALQEGVRIVCGRNTGTAEIVKGIRGCAIFEQPEVGEALNALRRALTELPDSQAMQEQARRIASPEAFTQRFDDALGGGRG